MKIVRASVPLEITGLSLATEAELLDLLGRILAAARQVHPEIKLGAEVQAGMAPAAPREVQRTALGDATVEAYAHVRRKSGAHEYFKVVDGQHVPITEQEYNDYHAAPDLQAALAQAEGATRQ